VRQTLLIRAPSHLGDLLMALPVLRAIEVKWPAGYRIEVAGAVEEGS